MAGTDTATVTLDVGGKNDQPEANPDVGATDENTTLVVSAADGVILGAGRDTDIDGDSLSVSAVAFGASNGKVGQPLAGDWGSLTLEADGSYRYTPNSAAQGLDDGESRVDVFTYTVTDPAGLTLDDDPDHHGHRGQRWPGGHRRFRPHAGRHATDPGPDSTRRTTRGESDSDPDGDPLTITEINGQPITLGSPVDLFDSKGVKIGGGRTESGRHGHLHTGREFQRPGGLHLHLVGRHLRPDEGAVRIVVDDLNDPPVALDNVVEGLRGHAVHLRPALQ